MQKYEPTDEKREWNGSTLRRIKALKDFGGVKAGDLGGWVESERNLSQEGNCWVYDTACIWGNAEILGNAQIIGKAEIWGNAWISGNARIWGNAEISDEALIWGNAEISDDAQIFGNARVYDRARISGDAKIWDNARIFGNAEIWGDARIYDNACILGNAWIWGNARIRGNAKIQSDRDYIVFKNWWSSGRYFTWTRSNDMWHVGCFYGTGKELIERAYKDSEESGREYERTVRYVERLKAR